MNGLTVIVRKFLAPMASKLAGKRGRKKGAHAPPEDWTEIDQVETLDVDEEAALVPGDDDSSGEELDTRGMVEEAIRTYWEKQNAVMEGLTEEDLRATPELPLARIKKIMKLDESVKMISSEVPLLFSKAATMFIEELTLKAWLHTEDAKRKTLQKSDIAKALGEDEMYDFLIDIVPRDESCPSKISKSRAVSKQQKARPEFGEADTDSQNLFLSEDQIKACMELLRKQIAQEDKLQESWKNAEDVRPEVEIQLLIQQQLLQHQVLLQYLENILEAKDGDCTTSSQDIQNQISQLMGTSRQGLLEYLQQQQQQQQRDESEEGLMVPQEMLGELEEGRAAANPDLSTSDADVGETLLPPTSSHPHPRDYVLPSNFNFSNNNLFLDGASLLSPLEHTDDPSAPPAGKFPLDIPISSAYQLLDESIED